MKTSDQTNEIAKALSMAQGKLKKATKEAKGYNYKYTRLEDYFDVCRDVLAEFNLCVIQFPSFDGNNVTVTTRVEHLSGQYYASDLQMPVAKKDAKEVGAAITYARKYGLSSMLGIVGSEEDPDEDQTPKTNGSAKKIPDNDKKNSQPFFDPTSNKVTIEGVKELIQAATTKSQLNQAASSAQSLSKEERDSIRTIYEQKKSELETKEKPA